MQDTKISEIINKRAKDALWAVAIISGVLIYMAAEQEINFSIILATIVLIIVPFIFLYAINKANYPIPKLWYRKFNSIFYLHMARILSVLSIFATLVNIKRFLNPFENYKKPGNPSHGEYFVDIGAEAVTAWYLYKGSKRAEEVEVYFQQKEPSKEL